jgi:predicted dinucleotide-binding enzyme
MVVTVADMVILTVPLMQLADTLQTLTWRDRLMLIRMLNILDHMALTQVPILNIPDHMALTQVPMLSMAPLDHRMEIEV